MTPLPKQPSDRDLPSQSRTHRSRLDKKAPTVQMGTICSDSPARPTKLGPPESLEGEEGGTPWNGTGGGWGLAASSAGSDPDRSGRQMPADLGKLLSGG